MAPAHRQVLILAGAQALFQTASVLVMTVGGLAGRDIASDPQLATAPIAAMFFGTAAAMAPAAWLMTRHGRRVGFMIGALLALRVFRATIRPGKADEFRDMLERLSIPMVKAETGRELGLGERWTRRHPAPRLDRAGFARDR